jgi:molybdopterin-guanine dinucleotide biosynthesis protein A
VDYDAIVLAGGRALRLGGIDKTALAFNGRSLLKIALDAVRGAATVVVVGPRRPGYEDVDWLLEDPPDSGPAHALAAGLMFGSEPIIVLLGADYPFVAADVIARLRAATEGHDGAIATDEEGRDQYLLGAYSRSALTAALRSRSSTEGTALAEVVESLRVARSRESTAAFDCDTWVDVAKARRLGDKGG